tara:strand:- start:31753 stop:32847 length:1095 start_codon:yes stop_codon:yes gene_type:complete
MTRLSPLFLDKASSGVRTILEFSPSIQNLVTSEISGTMSPAAIARLGVAVVSETPVSRSYENAGVGGVRLGNVTVYENGEPAEQIDMRHFDIFRTGKNIKLFKHFGVQCGSPMVRISPEGFFEENTPNVINHQMQFNSFGMGLNYKTVDENYVFIPFVDFSQVVAADAVSGSVAAYPFVHDRHRNIDHYMDPSKPKHDGAIDTFEVRSSLTNLSVSDIMLFGAKSSFAGGGIDQAQKGGVAIANKFEITKPEEGREIFDDSQETMFSGVNFKKRGVNTSLSENMFPLPGFVDNSRYKLSPFKENVDYISGSYTFATSNMNDFLSSSRNSIGDLGTRFKSATCGLVFNESNKYGTDSIAFGGLKK